MAAQYRLPEAEHLFARKVRAMDSAGIHARIWTRRPESNWVQVSEPPTSPVPPTICNDYCPFQSCDQCPYQPRSAA